MTESARYRNRRGSDEDQCSSDPRKVQLSVIRFAFLHRGNLRAIQLVPRAAVRFGVGHQVQADVYGLERPGRAIVGSRVQGPRARRGGGASGRVQAGNSRSKYTPYMERSPTRGAAYDAAVAAQTARPLRS